MTSYDSHTSLAWPAVNVYKFDGKQLQPASKTSQPTWNQNNEFQTVSSSYTPFENQFSKLSLSVPLPKQETLSRHSFLGSSGLRSQWQGPSSNIKVNSRGVFFF